MNWKPWQTILLLLGLAITAFGWLYWKCDSDRDINFLPHEGRHHWVIFPSPLDARSHPVAMMDATFRRTFTLDSPPKTALLEVCAARRLELKINSQIVPTPSNEWKKKSTFDVSRFLRAGENRIEVRVFNDSAPPALWLHLAADKINVQTDGNWEASLAGSSWRSCSLASIPRKPGPGNLLAGGEKVSEVVSKVWRPWTGFAILAVLLGIGFQRWIGNKINFSHQQALAVVGICVLAWAILFWNNAKLLSFHSGYDVKDHVAYIKYIQERGALPLPNEGYEMFQPPLFYALSAGLLSIFHLSTDDPGAVEVLRALTMLFGIGNFILVFLSLRLLFPKHVAAHVIGLMTAAFLPMQLYLAHYITNETLAGTLASLTIYLALRVLLRERAFVWEFLILGVAAGAALLAKATDILLIPPLLGALAIKLWRQRGVILEWTRTVGVTAGAMLIVCGWHYLRIWRQFGTPIVGNWDPAVQPAWWQDPGFHVAADYFRFGQSLVAPMFSGFNGFADGIYSTLWGDSLGGGLSAVLSRTPWNYSLMIGGYWLALVPMGLVLVGVATGIVRLVRRISPEWFLLLGLSAATVIALIFMTLRVPSYAQVKAFYGLAALVPFCGLIVLGWQTLADRSRMLQPILTAFLIFVAINSFASVWIRPSSELHTYNALRLIVQSQPARAASEAAAAVAIDPSNANAAYVSAAILDETDEPDKAISAAERCLELDQSNGYCHFQLGIGFARQRQLTRALREVQRAVELIPENARARGLNLSLAVELRLGQSALTVGRDALAVSPYDSELHYRVGLVAGELADLKTAAQQFGYASLLAPNPSAEISNKLHLTIQFVTRSPDASSQLHEMASMAPESAALLNELAWIFATHPDPGLRDGARAINLAQRACALTGQKQPAILATAAAGLAEAGNFSEAVTFAESAHSLARLQGDSKTVALADKMLTAFRSSQPYREDALP